MLRVILSLVFFTVLLGGCRTVRQPADTVPVAGTGAIVDGSAAADSLDGTVVESRVNSSVGNAIEEDRRYEYRGGR